MKTTNFLLSVLSILLFSATAQSQTLPGKFWSSWIGNTFGGKNSSFGSADPNDPNDKWIQDYIDCMSVTEDGTCYTSSGWDEAHREFGIYKDGDVLGNKDMAITCGTAGNFTIAGSTITGNGKTITDAGKPTAIAMGRGNYAGKLLVADNGQRKQILIYDVSGTPQIIEKLGVDGGIASDFTPTYEFPAAINAPSYPVKNYPPGYYHPLKLWGLTGVGCDNTGRIFVSTSECGSAIRCFKKVNNNWILDWRVENYFFVDNVFYDEKTDAAEVYGVQEHMRLDFSKNTAGKEWSIIGYTVDAYNYPEDPRAINEVKAGGEHGLTAVIEREINGTRYLWISGMTCQPPKIFKFKPNTDIAVPCGMFMARDSRIYDLPTTFWWPPQRPSTNVPGTLFWSDLNNDGKFQSNEYSMQKYNFNEGDFSIDKSGNIWQGGNPIRIWKPTFEANGNVVYSDQNVEEITIDGLYSIGKLVLQEEMDRLVVLTTSCRNINGGKMYIIDNWSKGNRSARYVADLKGPNQSNWTVAGDYAFECGWETKATVWVTDLNTGKLVGTMIPDASCGGVERTGWVDISAGIRAYKRKTSGEYLVFVEDDFLSRVILYRWCPTGDCIESDLKVSLVTPETGKTYMNNVPLVLNAEVLKDTSVVSKVEFLINDSIIGQSFSAPYQYTWNKPTTGFLKAGAKVTSTQGAVAYSDPTTFFKITDGSPEIQFDLFKTNYSIIDTVYLKANVTDFDDTIDSVMFYTGDSILFADKEFPYVYNYSGLPEGIWPIKVKAVDKSGKSSWSKMILITVSTSIKVDDNDKGWIWSGFTYDPSCTTCYNGTNHQTNVKNSFGQYTFTGSYVEAYCETWDGAGSVEIFIDGVSKGIFPQNITPYGGAQKFATFSGLTNTSHTIKFVSTDNIWVGVDYFVYSDGTKPLVGVLTGNFVFGYSDVNLSSGTADWKHFTNNDHKATGAKVNSISDYVVIGGVSAPYSDDLRKISWSDGVPTISTTNNQTGISIGGINKGFSFSVSAQNATDTLYIYVSGNNAGGTLTGHLSNYFAPDFERTVATTRKGKWDGTFMLIYDAKQNGKKLEISWVQSAGTGSIALQAASILENPDFMSGIDGSIKKSPAIQVYPNPYKDGELTVKMNGQGYHNITIVDITGKIVYKTQTNASTVNIPNLSLNKGIYIVKVYSDNMVGNAKLILE
jgi:hypothetical protein